MQEDHMVFEYWQDKWASEYRRLHKRECPLLPEIKQSNENWLEECSAPEAFVLLASTPGASKCSQCLQQE